MKNLTPAEEEAYVRERWFGIENPTEECIWLYGRKDTDKDPMLFTNWHEAYLYTKRREAEIAELMKDIKWASARRNRSIVSRLQAALAELKDSWKG